MKRLLENHNLKDRKVVDKETRDVYCVEDVYELSHAGNAYLSLLVYQATEGERSHAQIDWEMLIQEEDSDIGTHWNSHINDNRERYELIEEHV
jgi:hypothetical protein